MPRPELWLLAGPNGAGKSTAVQRSPISTVLPTVGFINPDDRTLAKLHALGFAGFHDPPGDILKRLFLESADEVSAEIESRLKNGDAVGVETVLSTAKYQPSVEFVKSQGGFFGLIYIALRSAVIARSRVALRVARSGHDVPPDKGRDRCNTCLGSPNGHPRSGSMTTRIPKSGVP